MADQKALILCKLFWKVLHLCCHLGMNTCKLLFTGKTCIFDLGPAAALPLLQHHSFHGSESSCFPSAITHHLLLCDLFQNYYVLHCWEVVKLPTWKRQFSSFILHLSQFNIQIFGAEIKIIKKRLMTINGWAAYTEIYCYSNSPSYCYDRAGNTRQTRMFM